MRLHISSQYCIEGADDIHNIALATRDLVFSHSIYFYTNMLERDRDSVDIHHL